MDVATIVTTLFFTLLGLFRDWPTLASTALVQRPVPASVERVECPAIDPVTRALLARCEVPLEPPFEE